MYETECSMKDQVCCIKELVCCRIDLMHRCTTSWT